MATERERLLERLLRRAEPWLAIEILSSNDFDRQYPRAAKSFDNDTHRATIRRLLSEIRKTMGKQS